MRGNGEYHVTIKLYRKVDLNEMEEILKIVLEISVKKLDIHKALVLHGTLILIHLVS